MRCVNANLNEYVNRLQVDDWMQEVVISGIRGKNRFEHLNLDHALAQIERVAVEFGYPEIGAVEQSSFQIKIARFG